MARKKKVNKNVLLLVGLLVLALYIGKGEPQILVSQCNRCDPNNIPVLENDLIFCESEHGFTCEVTGGCLVCSTGGQCTTYPDGGTLSPPASDGSLYCNPSDDTWYECSTGSWIFESNCNGECILGICESGETCTDSDGQDFTNKGYVIDINYQGGERIYDDCSSPTPTYVYEVICLADQYDVIVKDCKEVFGMYGCADGACVECLTDLDCVAKYEDGYTCENGNVCELTTTTCIDYPNNYGSCSLGGGSVCTVDNTAILSGCSDLDPSGAYVYCWTQSTACGAGKECTIENLQATCITSPSCSTHSECDDGNECTNDVCNTVCIYSNKADGTLCSGGTSVCSSGYCSIPECTNGETQICTIETCAGTRTCVNQQWGACVKDDPPNCNGTTPPTEDGCVSNEDCLAFFQKCKSGECEVQAGSIILIILALVAFKMFGKN